MKDFWIYITCLMLLSLCSGCVTAGLLYTHVTRPLDSNMSVTVSGVGEATGSVKHVKLPVLGQVDLLWDSAAVGEIAKENGLKKVYYADLEELRVLWVWNKYTVHLYGE